MIRTCLICHKEFSCRPYRVKIGGGKYCSHECSSTARRGKPGKSHPISEEQKKRSSQNMIKKWAEGFFKPTPKGFNKGIKRSKEFKKHLSEIRMESRNPMWKGDNVGYAAIHEWIKNRFPKPELCQNCHKSSAYDLANISGEYKRDLSDWKWLCRKCHMTEDGRLENFRQLRKKRLELQRNNYV